MFGFPQQSAFSGYKETPAEASSSSDVASSSGAVEQRGNNQSPNITDDTNIPRPPSPRGLRHSLSLFPSLRVPDSPLPNTLEAMNTITKLANDLDDLEKNLVALEKTSEPAEQPQHRIEQKKVIRRTQAKLKHATDEENFLKKQYNKAASEVEQITDSLAQKNDSLKKLEIAYREIIDKPSTSATKKDANYTVTNDTGLSEIEELKKTISLLQKTLAQVNIENVNADEFEKLRELSAGTLQNASGKANPELVSKITDWLRGLQPKERKKNHNALSFDTAQKRAFERIANHAAGDQEYSSQHVVSSLLFATSRSKVSTLHTTIENWIAKSIARYLITSDGGRRSEAAVESIMSPFRKMNMAPNQVTTTAINKAFKQTVEQLQHAVRQGVPYMHLKNPFLRESQMLSKDQINVALKQCKELSENFTQHFDAFQTVLESMGKDFSARLRDDDIAMMRKHVAPRLKGHYEKRIDAAKAEIKEISKKHSGLSKVRADKPSDLGSIEEISKISFSPDTDSIEKRVSSLKGEIADLSERFIKAKIELDEIDGKKRSNLEKLLGIKEQLEQDNKTQQQIQEEKFRKMQDGTQQATEKEKLEKSIAEFVSEVIAHPAVSRIISPKALERAINRHVQQDLQSMESRIKKRQTSRTGSLTTIPSLLRTLVDIVQNPNSGFLAKSHAEFLSIAKSKSAPKIQTEASEHSENPTFTVNCLTNHRRSVATGVVRRSSGNIEKVNCTFSRAIIEYSSNEGPCIIHYQPEVPNY